MAVFDGSLSSEQQPGGIGSCKLRSLIQRADDRSECEMTALRDATPWSRDARMTEKQGRLRPRRAGGPWRQRHEPLLSYREGRAVGAQLPCREREIRVVWSELW
jgi:hypothetical protein